MIAGKDCRASLAFKERPDLCVINFKHLKLSYSGTLTKTFIYKDFLSCWVQLAPKNLYLRRIEQDLCTLEH